MKRLIVFVLGTRGFFNPLSITTVCNMERAVRQLDRNECHLIYLALNHLGKKDRIRSHQFIYEYFINHLSDRLHSRIFVSDSDGDYVEKFFEYKKINPLLENADIEILTNHSYGARVHQEISQGRSFAAR